MSLVSHDSTLECHNGVIYESKDDTTDKNKTGVRVFERETQENTSDKELKRTVSTLNTNLLAEINKDGNRELKDTHNDINVENFLERHTADGNEIKILRYKTSDLVENNGNFEAKGGKRCDSTKYEHYNTGDTGCDGINNNNKYKVLENLIIENSDKNDINKQNFAKQMFHNKIAFKKHARKSIKITYQNNSWRRQNKSSSRNQNSASNELKRLNQNCGRKSIRNFNSGVIISLIILNVAGFSNGVDTSSFSPSLTSRMVATFLGYPSTCSLGGEVRACTLTLTCWLRGGTRLRGCGGWLFSCCGLPDPNPEIFDNSIPSSEWIYKPPSQLHQVPQRSILPNNVFRRRVDDDVTQMDCGLPSSRILQKRIIGGREARFAEFPWQAHVRISEFQCGGVLVSRRYVATAAHCVSRAHTRDIAVWLGAIDTSATHHPARKLGVIQKVLHPLFQFRMTQPDRYDIALLKLSRPITYMSHILPICLPDHDLKLRGRSGVIAGWGKTDASSGHTGTNLLRSASVPILSKEQCINWHQSKQISVEIHSEMICAGHSDGHQDACLGDSGGPLIVLDNGRYYLVGITSAGFGCGVDHQPGIYHNVKLTANWIRSIISPPVNYKDNYLN